MALSRSWRRITKDDARIVRSKVPSLERARDVSVFHDVKRFPLLVVSGEAFHAVSRSRSVRDARDSKKSYGKNSKTYSKKRCVQRCVRARACVRRRRRRASMRSTSLNRMRSMRSTSRSRRRRACDSPRARAGGERRVNARITLRARARRARVARHPMDQSTRCRDADKNAKKTLD